LKCGLVEEDMGKRFGANEVQAMFRLAVLGLRKGRAILIGIGPVTGTAEINTLRGVPTSRFSVM